MRAPHGCPGHPYRVRGPLPGPRRGGCGLRRAEDRPAPWENQGMDRIGVVDTMFARYDMGAEAVDELKQCPGFGERFEVIRRTVPGFKDLGVACKKLVQEEGCSIVVALGYAGQGRRSTRSVRTKRRRASCSPSCSLTTHVLEVFVHENEEDDPEAPRPRCAWTGRRKHARNAYWMLYEPDQLSRRRWPGRPPGLRRRRAPPSTPAPDQPSPKPRSCARPTADTSVGAHDHLHAAAPPGAVRARRARG